MHRYKYEFKTGVTKVKTKLAIAFSTLALAAGGTFASLAIFGSAHAAGTTWQLNAPSTLTFVCGGGDYVHTLNTVSEDQSTGNFTGTGSYNADTTYTWDASGNVTDNNFNMTVTYTDTSAGSVYNLVGTIAPDGSISGTSDSNCQTFSMPAGTAVQNSDVIVTPSNTQGWFSHDTRQGGAINYLVDPSAPGNPHVGALQLTTDATTTSKAQYMHLTDTQLSDVGTLGYSTKQNSASFVSGDASYQLATCLGGLSGTTCTGFTTFVYEPYENGTVIPGQWQSWDVDAGQMWSSRSFSDGTCTVVAGGGGAPFYNLAALKTACPNAVVVEFGVNIGSNNPSYNVEADLVNFNGTTYNFEPYVIATDKDACKNGGWMNLADSNGHSFKNQGDCVSYVATGGRNMASTKTH
jgi:hypothetical protein